MPEWEDYACIIPKNKGRSSNSESSLLSTVYHIVHLPMARRILEDRCLHAGLVYDESKLNRSRTCVTWLSANMWVEGSIYGNVCFAFDWAKIIEDRQVYWVEAMTDYKPHAYRFLLTDRDMSGSKYVVPYDPESDRGPLRKQKSNWYWNDNYTSEFMLEVGVFLRDCTGLSFVSHHPSICRLDRSGCAHKSTSRERSAGQVLAFLLSSNLHAVDQALLRERQDGTRSLTSEAENGVTGIWRAFARKKERFCGVIKKATSRKSVLRGALALYSTEQDQAAKDLVSLLHSQEVFEKAFIEIIEEHFNLDDYKLPD